MSIDYIYNDGGRAAAGFKGTAGDCGVRALAIAAEMDYREAYNLANRFCRDEKTSKRRRGISSARTGIHGHTYRKIVEHVGGIWVPTMRIGSGCKVHLRADELPEGRIICNVSRHFVAVIDGVINDLYDPSRGGTRCVYGYFRFDRK